MTKNLRISDLQQQNKPRERLIQKGTSALSDAELLAIILRSGGKRSSALDLANLVLSKFGGFLGLAKADLAQIIELKDIGVAKGASIAALFEISLRISATNTEKKLKIKNPRDVFKLMRKETFAKGSEHLFVISLDVRGVFLSKDLVSKGTLNESLVGVREVFKLAFLKNAAQIILVHNHPSGDPTPSAEDIKVTKDVSYVGNLLNITLIDHVIVSDNDFASVKSQNIFEQYKFDYERG